jgi:hypothetical protein
MYIEKNTYVCLEENKEAILNDLHDYFKNIYFMKALNQALGPTFPGNTSAERIQLLNVFYLNVFNGLLKHKSNLTEVKKALVKLASFMVQDYRTNPDVFKKIIFLCGMFKEHYNVNLTGIPANMLQYVIDNIEVYSEGLESWSND